MKFTDVGFIMEMGCEEGVYVCNKAAKQVVPYENNSLLMQRKQNKGVI